MTSTRLANVWMSAEHDVASETHLEQREVRCSPVPRVWVLTNAPSPYQVELLNEAASRDEMKLSMRFMRSASPAGRAVEAATEIDSKVLWGILPESLRDEFRLHPRAIWEVLRGKHDVYVLSGLYTSPTFLLCATASVITGKKYVLWLERQHASETSKSGLRWHRRLFQSVKRKYLRWLLRHAASVWCIGTRAEHDYLALGAINGATRVLPYCCRVDRFKSDDSSAAALRLEEELEGRFVFLFSGQLIHRKGIDTLLRAFSAILSQNSDATLLLLGEGPSRAEYVALALELGIASHVRFLGHRSQGELPEWFGIADAFVFPSRHDGWAVVINEACAAGLPILASTQTGAAPDLVQEGINGFVIDCEDVDRWAERMTWCLDHRDELRAMGKASRQIVERFSSEAGATRMTEYVHELLQSSSTIQESAKST